MSGLAGRHAEQENLKAINKKMVCIYKLLHQQTSQPPNLQQSLEVLDAAERQIKHWLQQLQIKDAKPAQVPWLIAKPIRHSPAVVDPCVVLCRVCRVSCCVVSVVCVVSSDDDDDDGHLV